MVGVFITTQVTLAEGLLGAGTIWGWDKPCAAVVPAWPELAQVW